MWSRVCALSRVLYLKRLPWCMCAAHCEHDLPHNAFSARFTPLRRCTSPSSSSSSSYSPTADDGVFWCLAPQVSLKVAVVGAGPAGLAAACTAAERGHAVTLFDSSSEIGGQFNLAKRIPGKEEFHETIRCGRG